MENTEIKLTPKQEKFVQGLFIGLSQREAYKQAYRAEKMKDKSIDEKACEVAKNVKVASRLKELQALVTIEHVDLEKRIVEELTKIAFVDIKDYISFKTEQQQRYNQEGVPYLHYEHTINIKDSSEIDGTLISEVSLSRDGTLKFKLHDKISALDKIAKIKGMYQDQKLVAAGGGDTVNYVFNLTKPAELPEVIETLEEVSEDD